MPDTTDAIGRPTSATHGEDDILTIHWSTDHKTTVICEVNDTIKSYIGTAHCAPGDIFNYGVGQTIALARALAGFTTELVAVARLNGGGSVLTYHEDGRPNKRMLHEMWHS